MLAKSAGLFAGLMVAGTLLTLQLFHWDRQRFLASPLARKILMWIPIFAVYMLFCFGGALLQTVIIGLLIAAVATEHQILTRRRPELHWLSAAVVTVLALALVHFLLFPMPQSLSILIAIGFASAVSDVCAFFGGQFLGRHKLPAYLNDHKSWEGVAGQLVGAALGVMLVQAFITPVPLWLAIPIGLGSAAGDLLNSFAKRRAGIKDWGGALPGHGGFTDRLSSLAGAAALTYYATWLIG